MSGVDLPPNEQELVLEQPNRLTLSHLPKLEHLTNTLQQVLGHHIFIIFSKKLPFAAHNFRLLGVVPEVGADGWFEFFAVD